MRILAIGRSSSDRHWKLLVESFRSLVGHCDEKVISRSHFFSRLFKSKGEISPHDLYLVQSQQTLDRLNIPAGRLVLFWDESIVNPYSTFSQKDKERAYALERDLVKRAEILVAPNNHWKENLRHRFHFSGRVIVIPPLVESIQEKRTETILSVGVLLTQPSAERSRATVLKDLENIQNTRAGKIHIEYAQWDGSQDVKAFFSKHHVGLLLTHDPWWYQGIIECYGARSVPIVCRGGGHAEFVSHRSDGLVVNLSEPGLLAQSLKELVDDPALMQKMEKNGREKFKNQFDPKVVCPRIMEFLRKEYQYQERTSKF